MFRIALPFVVLAVSGFAQQLPNADLLTQPPKVAAAAKCPAVDEWSTPSEKTCYRTTPRYDETMQYVHRLAQAAPKQIRLEVFGKTGQGRDLVAMIVSRDGQFDPAALHKANRPVVFVQNAIHAGEMDGKDATLALIRDMVVNKKLAGLLDRIVLVNIPIYNADGHEWFGPYNRINQNGPEQMGWRTNARQLNLNRDYLKADAPETVAWLAYWNKWLPDFFVDDHVTDGADYQADVTYYLDADRVTSPATADWADKSFIPEFERRVSASGHVVSPYIDFAGQTPDTGIPNGQSTPRFSTGYVHLQNRPAFLIEMHMLKDYATRVTGNYEALKAILEIVHRDADKLIAMNRAADQATIAAGREHRTVFPIRLEPTGESVPMEFKGYRWTVEKSDLSGATWISYHQDQPITMTIQRQVGLKPTITATIPAAYIVPVEWTPLIRVLEAHGLAMRRTTQPWTGEVETYRCETPQWVQQPFESRHTASWPAREGPQSFVARESGNVAPSQGCRAVREKMTFPAGSVIVPMDQRAAKVAIHWLEPMAPDSAMQWGLLDSIFEQKEYGEGYVLERLARKMLEADPKLKEEFDQKVASDPQFAGNRFARLNWFYQRSPWWDPRIGLYPVGKLNSLTGVSVK